MVPKRHEGIPKMSQAKATIRSAQIAYDVAGSGPDLVWGHGLSQTRAIETALGLLDWSRIPARVVCYDTRGHGLSETTPDPAGYSWEELARDQLALADHLEISEYIAAGASMGAGTALHAAVLAPERIRRLVLVIPPTGWETRAAQADEWETTAHVLETRGVEPIIAAWAEVAPLDPFVGDDDRRALREAATRSWDPVRLAQVMRGAATADLPPRDRIAEIAVPTLILAWTGDAIHPLSTADELAALLPHSRLEVASTAAQVARWTDLLADFLVSA